MGDESSSGESLKAPLAHRSRRRSTGPGDDSDTHTVSRLAKLSSFSSETAAAAPGSEPDAIVGQDTMQEHATQSHVQREPDTIDEFATALYQAYPTVKSLLDG